MSVCKSHTRSHIVNLQVQYIQLYLHTCIVEVNYEGSAVIALSDWGIQLHAHALFSSSCESDIWIFCPHGHGFYSMQIHIYQNQVKRFCSTSQEMWSGKHILDRLNYICFMLTVKNCQNCSHRIRLNSLTHRAHYMYLDYKYSRQLRKKSSRFQGNWQWVKKQWHCCIAMITTISIKHTAPKLWSIPSKGVEINLL